MLSINSSISIPLQELEFTFARSGGPGGQNVNKVNSKAVLRWAVVNSASLPEGVRSRFLAKYANRLTTDGELILSSQKYRDQSRNIDDCLVKLQKMIALVVGRPKLRRPTKPTLGAQGRRKKDKLATAAKKQHRRPATNED
jgi:ribosome-associated protein